MPEGDNPWAVRTTSPTGTRLTVDDTWKPSRSLQNSEVAAKVAGFFSGLDVAASAFYTWDDMPVMHKTLSFASGTPQIDFRPRHHRMTVLGLEASRPWSDFVFRGEAAWYLGRYRETILPGRDPVQKDSLKWLLGLDWTPGDDWSVSLQVMNEAIFEYENSLAAEENESLATVNISKKFFNQVITLSSMVYYDLNDRDFYNRSKVEYEISDGFFASIGLDLFNGDSSGQYGMYKDNTQIWCRLKYSF